MKNHNRQRRQLLQASGVVLLLGRAQLAWGASILAVRVWPAVEYTRVTIESDTLLKVTHTFVANPPRLAVDIEGIELNAALRDLVGKVRNDDPFITGVRIGQFTPPRCDWCWSCANPPNHRCSPWRLCNRGNRVFSTAWC